MKKSLRSSNAPVGGSSLLVIFAVLCLTIFALLALTTVEANLRQAKKSREAIEAYQKADYQAEEILASLRSGVIPEGVVRDADTYAYSVDISDTQVLTVVVSIEGQDYSILRWKSELTEEWEPEKYIKVFDPEDVED